LIEWLTDEEEDMIFEIKPKLFSIGIITLLEKMVSLFNVGVLKIRSTEKFDLEQGISYQIVAKVVPSIVKSKKFCVRPKVSLEDKVYPSWTLIEKQQLVKLNLGTKANPQNIKVNSLLTKEKIEKLQMLLKEFKDVFSWIYKDLKGIPLALAQHRIELDTSIPPAHQARYKLNPNYVAVVK
jgi:hypothetical protein